MSDSESSTQQTNQQTDNRRVIGQNGISAEGSTVTVNALDAGVANTAITTTANAAVDNLKTALQYSSGTLGQALGFAQSSQSAALDSLNTQANLVKDAYADAKGRGALTDKILIGAIAMAGVVAFAAIKKG